MTDKTIMLPCPFCGFSDIDRSFWRTSSEHGPGCSTCAATAVDDDTWNTRTNSRKDILYERLLNRSLLLLQEFAELVDGDMKSVGGGTRLGFDGRLTAGMIKNAKQIIKDADDA